MLIDYRRIHAPDIYRLMSQTIVPRPIAWVVTENEGVVNAAPFSYFTGLSSSPPTMIVSVGHKSDGTPKDTLRNLRETKKCTVCIVTPEQLEAMHLSSKELPPDTGEAEAFDIPLERLVEAWPPMVANVPAAFFCELYDEVGLEGSKTIPLVLRIREQFIDDRFFDPDTFGIDFEPLARVGKRYARLGAPIDPPKIP